jgi:hypothetical protein
MRFNYVKSMKVKDKGTGALTQKAKTIAKHFDAKGCIIILYDKDKKGRIANYLLSYEEIRESLCIANYHNEKIRIENELLPKKLP